MNLQFKTFDDVDLVEKRVLIRVDMNCSVDPESKEITDDSRIVAILPTLRELAKSKLVLMAHQGRPGSDDFISLEAHTDILRKHGLNASFVDDIFGEKAKTAIEKVAVGEMGYELNIERVDSVKHGHWENTSQSHRAFVFSRARAQ